MNRCDFCLDEKCGKDENNRSCNCKNCSHINECYKFLHATIRITTKCTQECSHCCFSCSPECDKMMTIERAKTIATFLKANEILSLNVMGGEFFCNPDWFEILSMFLEVSNYMRLVSNGDWANNDDVKDKLLKLKETYGNKFYISISNDRWHHNKFVDKAKTFLDENNFLYVIGTEENDDEDVIVPIGKSELSFGLYGMFACYCHNPKHEYSFLIDEKGIIYKCSFGVFDYAAVDDYLNGGFAKVFKEYNKKFYSIFIPSCASCVRCAKQSKRTSLQQD